MLVIDIPASIYEKPGTWDGHKKQLVRTAPAHLEMEHSLLSIWKWESKWKIPFSETRQMTTEQFLDYCRCMTINKQKDPDVYKYLRQKDAQKIAEYMTDNMSARVIRGNQFRKKRGPKIRMTSEYYYWLMTQYNIPFDCEKWHFNRLLALIDCCSSNNGDSAPMSYREKQQYYALLNAQRRKLSHTTG